MTTMSLPPLAMIDMGMNLLKILAIAGGAAVGALGSGLLLRLVGKLSLGRKVPRIPLRVVQLIGGATLGVAVYWAFGPGGSGFGGDGSGFSGKGPGDSLSTDMDSRPDPLAAKEPARNERPPTGSDVLRVEMLGGDRVKQDRFYLLEGDKQPRNLADLRNAIRARREAKDKPELERLEIVVYEDSVAPDHPAVRDLKKWAEQNHLSVTMNEPAGASR